MTAFNQSLEPLLTTGHGRLEGPSGVIALDVSARDATSCATYLQREWTNGRLKLIDPDSGRLLGTCFGYASCWQAAVERGTVPTIIT